MLADKKIMEQWRETLPSSRYKVSDRGNVRGPSGKHLKPTLMQIGYFSVALSFKSHKVVRDYVHRLVAEAFLGQLSDGLIVNHKNHNKLDNRLGNLEIISRKDNASHWAAAKRSTAAGRKRSGYCGRGHKLLGNRTYCLECRRLKAAGHTYTPPEDAEWKQSTVKGYLISNDGRIWSEKTKRLIRMGINIPGYSYSNLRSGGKTQPFATHRLVAEAFIRELRDDEVVDHIDGDKLNNTVGNLRVTTRSLNTTAFRDRVREERNHGFKLDESDVLEIKRYLAEGKLTQREIGVLFNVGDSIISAINTGRKWAHVG
ncbi:HNH endonuclease [Akkermansiaceae bacterium]|nr:HNH endonuclease [Akkermansiaceae bacterium]